MTIEVKVPVLPESVEDAIIAAWHKQPGDTILRDENLVDLETDKVVLEVPAPVEGTIKEVHAAEGDTVSPDGNYVVALNKWSLDRFPVIGTLKPQNFQLIDLEAETGSRRVLYDMPIGFGEPHYVQMIRADRLENAIEVYDVGTEPLRMQPSEVATTVVGEERVDTSTPGEVHVYMTAIRSQFAPDTVRVKEGDKVFLHVTNVETTPDATHGFAIDKYNINLSLEPGETATVEFVANQSGTFPFYCTEFCSALHLEMAGYMLVQP